MIHQLTPSCIAVTVPEDAKDPWMLERPDPQLAYYLPNKSFGEEGNMWSESIKLPPGNWKILGKGSDLSEEQWKGIVEAFTHKMGYFGDSNKAEKIVLYMNYMIERPVPVTFLYCDAKDSGLSLLKSKGLNPDVLILTNTTISNDKRE